MKISEGWPWLWVGRKVGVDEFVYFILYHVAVLIDKTAPAHYMWGREERTADPLGVPG